MAARVTGETIMILILSHATIEKTTEDVIDWLEYFGARYFRLNGADLDATSPFAVALDGDHVEIQVGELTLSLLREDIRAVWFRRWRQETRHERMNLLRAPQTLDCATQLHTKLVKHLDAELRKLSEFFFALLQDVPWVSHPRTASMNKPHILRQAAQAGLEIPATLITSSKAHLQHFATQHRNVITKAISEVGVFPLHGQHYMLYTSEVSAADIAALPAQFFPSLFQERLEKAYEVRVFYLDQECYSMALFSQLDRQTSVDFRQYNLNRPNRYVPYRLPEAVAESIRRLMHSVEMETGSLDLVRTIDGRHVFLEINPVGQFGMVSYPCNYFLERKIAEFLLRKANHDHAA
jgi:ATP-GRASP peptide maturase of grasp-with-spasm system